MTDKEPDTAQADPETAQLAASILGEEVPTIIEGKDSVSPKDKPASEGKDAKPEDGKPPASDGKPESKVEGDGEPGEGEEKGEKKEDPLKDLAGDKTGALKTLLEHPILGPLLNRWADDAGNAQVATALARAKPITEADTRQADAVRAEDEHFSSMTKEQVAEEIAGDEEAATAYARYQERKQAAGQPNAAAIAESSQYYSYASRIAVVQGLLKDSDLSPEILETLKPEHFTHLKAEGIVEWEKAVFKAIVTHEASAIAAKEIAAKKETLNEEVMAEVDGERPAIVSGRTDGPTPDFMKTDSGALLESALSQKPKKGN
ncbi:hypothetical protein LCGC14_0970400 [marine sediment metagenome]|uniref:Uncharacterized protein n=1 Tax=marine sediment metagenome TaxID=412755 RepID=A0A0F9QV01_9ZZZZ